MIHPVFAVLIPRLVGSDCAQLCNRKEVRHSGKVKVISIVRQVYCSCFGKDADHFCRDTRGLVANALQNVSGLLLILQTSVSFSVE